MKRSPLAPAELKPLPEVAGVKLAAAEAGVKYSGRKDVMLMHFAPGSVMAGVFTQSATRSAPVLNSQEILGKEGEAGIAILANSGNSNAFTGQAGFDAMKACLNALADRLGISAGAVHMASTGVIGEPLNATPILNALDELGTNLAANFWADAARAIMTTDTFAKGASESVDLGGAVTITGIAKGSGMIAPNMATMLGFLATDAKISRPLLQKALENTSHKSFNAITVDSDTSTSDSVYLGATRMADMAPIDDESDPRFAKFEAALQSLMLKLAHQIVKDGEGASKFVEINVQGAVSESSARNLAMAVANSPLVKTAVAGEDPNWGRIVAAIGKAGEPADRDKIRISFGDILVAENGAVAPSYREGDGADYMKRAELQITIGLGMGKANFTVWTCDLTKTYIEINADYRS